MRTFSNKPVQRQLNGFSSFHVLFDNIHGNTSSDNPYISTQKQKARISGNSLI